MKSFGQVEYIVDINPHKQGRFVAGSGQQIVGPEFLKEYQPDIVLVMNPIYQNEIQDALEKAGLKRDLSISLVLVTLEILCQHRHGP